MATAFPGNPIAAGRAGWIVLLTVVSSARSFVFACATPLSAHTGAFLSFRVLQYRGVRVGLAPPREPVAA